MLGFWSHQGASGGAFRVVSDQATTRRDRAMAEGQLTIHMINCAIASSGVSQVGTQAFGAACTVVMTGIGAAVGAVVAAPAVIATFGLAAPVGVVVTGATAAGFALLTEAIVQGGIAGASSIGHTYPDNLYVTVKSDQDDPHKVPSKVFPVSDRYFDIASGQTLRERGVPSDRGAMWDVVLYEGKKELKVVKTGGRIYSAKPGGKTATIELWDHDTLSADDHLATFAVSLQEKMPMTAFMFANPEEESLYIVELSVT